MSVDYICQASLPSCFSLLSMFLYIAMEEQKEKLEQLAKVRLKSLLQEQEDKFQEELQQKVVYL